MVACDKCMVGRSSSITTAPSSLGNSDNVDGPLVCLRSIATKSALTFQDGLFNDDGVLLGKSKATSISNHSSLYTCVGGLYLQS